MDMKQGGNAGKPSRPCMDEKAFCILIVSEISKRGNDDN